MVAKRESLKIESQHSDGLYHLSSSTSMYGGGVYRAVVRTPYGFVIGSSISKELQGELANTDLEFMHNGIEFSARIEGKQYKPKGMVNLAREFVSQCVRQHGS